MAKSPVDFLHANNKMASILPTVERIAALQKDCALLLPDLFEACTVLMIDAGLLIIATPHAALATKLKHKLPKLRDDLLKRGWQVQAIRLKVQLHAHAKEKSLPPKQLNLSRQALSAWTALGNALAQSPRNDALQTAIKEMVQRHRGGSR